MHYIIAIKAKKCHNRNTKKAAIFPNSLNFFFKFKINLGLGFTTQQYGAFEYLDNLLHCEDHNDGV